VTSKSDCVGFSWDSTYLRAFGSFFAEVARRLMHIRPGTFEALPSEVGVACSAEYFRFSMSQLKAVQWV
jgi:hypothetical protein